MGVGKEEDYMKQDRQNRLRFLLEMFVTFLKIGMFTFGGGYAMIPLMEEEIIHKKGWMEEEEIMDLFAVSETVPGSIAINTSTFIGYKLDGAIGAITAMMGVVLPSFLIITIIAAFFGNISGNPMVDAAFLGIRTAVVALIWKAAGGFFKSAINSRKDIILLICTLVLLLFTSIHPVIIMVVVALLSVFAFKFSSDHDRNFDI